MSLYWLNTYHESPSLSIDDKSIKQVSSTKSLGVHIDENISWNVHIESIAKKIASGLGALKRCRRFVPQSTLHSVFSALIQPHFDYCSVVWGHCNKTLSDKLQKLQNRAARSFPAMTQMPDVSLNGSAGKDWNLKGKYKKQ